MSDYLALLVCVVILGAVWGVSRLKVWRRCKCGASYCTTCGRRGE